MSDLSSSGEYRQYPLDQTLYVDPARLVEAPIGSEGIDAEFEPEARVELDDISTEAIGVGEDLGLDVAPDGYDDADPFEFDHPSDLAATAPEAEWQPEPADVTKAAVGAAAVPATLYGMRPGKGSDEPQEPVPPMGPDEIATSNDPTLDLSLRAADAAEAPEVSDAPEQRPFTPREQVLVDHIEAGLNMIKEGGRDIEVRRHYLGRVTHEGEEVAVVEPGRTAFISELRTEAQARVIARDMAMGSHAGGPVGELGGWADRRTHSSDLSHDPERFNPTLVARIAREGALLGAEEWIHILQHEHGGPVAGHDDLEVDAAAFMYERGVELTPEYVARYAARVEWYIQRHPGGRSEMRQYLRRLRRS